MKKTWLILIGIVLFIPVLLGLSYIGIYNGLVSADENVKAAWSQVQNQYQRRYDLIPPLVNATKLYINYEKEVLTDIALARSAWTNSLEGTKEEQYEAMSGFDAVMNRLLMIMSYESYPELKADKIVMTLMDQLEGTENRIVVERMRYINTVRGYNKMIRRFPTNIVAGMSGFEKYPEFKAIEGADEGIKITIG